MAKFLDLSGVQRLVDKIMDWATPANIGAAPTSHSHSAANITSGTLPITRGGTGATSAANARENLGVTPANIGAAPQEHNHAAGDITSGTLPVSRGGTGRTALAGSSTSLLHDLFPSSGTLTYLTGFGSSWGNNRYATLASVRNQMGLGSTTGDLPIANGGTGASTAAQARVNLGVDISDETIQMFADAGYPIE